MAPTDPLPAGDDDTDLDYYDTPSGNIWRPDAGPNQQARGPAPGKPGPPPAITRNDAR